MDDINDMNEENTIVLYDEEGNEVEFDLIASLEVDEKTYAIVVPTDEESGDAYILRVEQNEDGKDVFVGIDDDDEFNAVAEAYEELSKSEDKNEVFDDDED